MNLNIFKKILNIAQWLIFFALISIAVAVVLSSFNTPLKFRLFSVLSGSMEPTLKVGSMVVVRSAEKYEKGDIITVRSLKDAKKTFTHRIIEITEGDKDSVIKALYRTKGDANEDKDPEPVIDKQVIGKVIFSIPYLGYIIGFAQTQMGLMVLVVIPGVIIIYTEVLNIIKEIKRMLKEKREKADGKKETLRVQKKQSTLKRSARFENSVRSVLPKKHLKSKKT